MSFIDRASSTIRAALVAGTAFAAALASASVADADSPYLVRNLVNWSAGWSVLDEPLAYSRSNVVYTLDRQMKTLTIGVLLVNAARASSTRSR